MDCVQQVQKSEKETARRRVCAAHPADTLCNAREQKWESAANCALAERVSRGKTRKTAVTASWHWLRPWCTSCLGRCCCRCTVYISVDVAIHFMHLARQGQQLRCCALSCSNCRLSLASSMQKKPLRRRWGKGSRQCLRHCGGTVEATLEPFDCLTTWLFECQMKLQLAMATRQSNNKGAAETRTQLKAARCHRDTHHATPQHSKDTRCQHYTTQHSKAQA